MWNMARALKENGSEVDILALNTIKHYVNPETIPEEARKIASIKTTTIDTSIRLWKAFLNLFSSGSYNIERFISKEFAKQIENQVLSVSYDLVQFESLFVVPYINIVRKNSSAKCVLRAHNIEFRIWERLADGSQSFIRKWYLQLLAKRLKTYELNSLCLFDAIIPITGEDADFIRNNADKTPVFVSPAGLNIQDYKSEIYPDEKPVLFHIGAMDWLPNQEAIKWFLDQVWEKVLQKFPDITLQLAGRNFPAWLKTPIYPQVVISENVPDAKDFMSDKQIMIVPLLSGGGMRVKIIEAMALGKAVISTTIGAEGIGCEDKKHILIADSPAAFLENIIKLVDNKSLRENIGDNARQFITEKFDNKILGKRLLKFYEGLRKE